MVKLEQSMDILKHNDVHLANSTIGLGRTKMNVFSFAVDGVLIDTGAKSLFTSFRPFFEQADFEQVMITHFHEDHTGCAAWIQSQRDVPFYIHKDSVVRCSEEFVYPKYRQFLWGQCEPFQAEAIGETFQSRNATWDVIATPGHTQDHLAFLNRETGALFTGDLFIHPKTKIILAEENIVDTLNSLRKIETYDFNDMYCCHAGYVQNGHKQVKEKMEYLEELQGEVVDLHLTGMSVEEITAQLFPKSYPIVEISDGEWSAIHIVRGFVEGRGQN
ncbi:MBL fold metallo-hydrolase [Viridibacillus sp. YIM B01967]|uniref:MBL fold metallo-hydrolase n=1 Tax=Viridibacillus soli TaxID=2798301 RepID=A0ABS1HA45_9BACL|nr:MBL fold metallo-hydrolase [Viridibacillus soli]MBK3496297.1 MBL fold metallo-hydrolase [Viridibacillus soli]